LVDDHRRTEALLRDICADHRREVNLLLFAQRENVPSDLKALGHDIPPDMVLTRLILRLRDDAAISEDAARWAVESWAIALGISRTAIPELRHPGTSKQKLYTGGYSKRQQDTQQLQDRTPNDGNPPDADLVHDRFERCGDDLYTTVSVPVWTAALGGDIEVTR
jgi:hypothetical protein